MIETSSRTLDIGLLSETHSQTIELPLHYQTLVKHIQSPNGIAFTNPLLGDQVGKKICPNCYHFFVNNNVHVISTYVLCHYQWHSSSAN